MKEIQSLFSLVSKDIKQKNGKLLAHIKESPEEEFRVAGCVDPSLYGLFSSSVLGPISGLIWEQLGCSSKSLYPLRFRCGEKVWLLRKSS